MHRIRTIKTRTGWRLERITGGRIECRTYSRAELQRLRIEYHSHPDYIDRDNAAYTHAEYLWDGGRPTKTEWKELA
jgi:hypothetical protein